MLALSQRHRLTWLQLQLQRVAQDPEDPAGSLATSTSGGTPRVARFVLESCAAAIVMGVMRSSSTTFFYAAELWLW